MHQQSTTYDLLLCITRYRIPDNKIFIHLRGFPINRCLSCPVSSILRFLDESSRSSSICRIMPIATAGLLSLARGRFMRDQRGWNNSNAAREGLIFETVNSRAFTRNHVFLRHWVLFSEYCFPHTSFRDSNRTFSHCRLRI